MKSAPRNTTLLYFHCTVLIGFAQVIRRHFAANTFVAIDFARGSRFLLLHSKSRIWIFLPLFRDIITHGRKLGGRGADGPAMRTDKHATVDRK